MNEKMPYGEAIAKTLFEAFIEAEQQRDELMSQIYRITTERGQEVVPELLMIQLTEAYRKINHMLQDWLDAEDLNNK